jgi:hypothetical protein
MSVLSPEQERQSPDGFKMRFALNLDGQAQPFAVRKLAHQQIAERVKVPWNYYERCMSEAPELVTENVNHWLTHSDDVRLVRTLDSQARAYLGDKYRPLDNYDLFTAVAPTLMGESARGMRIESIQITETKFYIKAFTDRITGEVKKGDVVQAGVVITNSEVGHGTLAVEPSVLRLLCLNGLTANDASLRRRHVGRGSEIQGVEEYFSDATQRITDEAFWRQVNDVVRGAFDEIKFKSLVEKMQATLDNRIPEGGATLQEVSEVFQKRYSLSATEGDMILKNLISGGDLSHYGIVNAITATAKNGDLSYQRADELEHIGGQVLELSRSEWKELIAA